MAARRQTFFRRIDTDRDPQELLDPANHRSTPWGAAQHGRCDKCRGEGVSAYACRSCMQEGADPACPACGGRVSYRDVCPACEGTGHIDRTTRHGVSVFPTLRGLYSYLAERDGDMDGHAIVELEGRLTGDVDLDADAGAVLIEPTAIVGVHPVRRPSWAVTT